MIMANIREDQTEASANEMGRIVAKSGGRGWPDCRGGSGGGEVQC